MSVIRVAVCGALGKMGIETVKTVLSDPELELVAVIGKSHSGETISQATCGLVACDKVIESDLKKALEKTKADVCVDFTTPHTVYENAKMIINAGCRPIIGTTGLMPEQMEELHHLLQQKKLGGLIAPNFAIGAVLLMKFAKEAAKYLDHAEIIEFHHNQKADAPSGTSLKTAHMMAETLPNFNPTNAPEKELYPGARGARGIEGNIPIHSVRLPGYVASQEVLFGAKGQILSIRHDSIDRTSFMPGIAMSCKEIIKKTGLFYGLEHLM